MTPKPVGQVDAGNIVGNLENKYSSTNPLARWLMRRFLQAVTELYQSTKAVRVLEVGCGEGYLADHLIRHARPEVFVACDVVRAPAPGLDPGIDWQEASIYALPYADNEFDVVVCCEVLEHLSDPAAGLAELARVARRQVLLSTPWEPVWRLMNLARGRYVRAWGNTPGHIQHFSRHALVRLAHTQLQHLQVRRPVPWTVILGDVRPR